MVCLDDDGMFRWWMCVWTVIVCLDNDCISVCVDNGYMFTKTVCVDSDCMFTKTVCVDCDCIFR